MKKQHRLTKVWTKILESAISNNKDLQDELNKMSIDLIESNLEKLKLGNDLERKVYEQYTKNKKLSPRVQKQHYAAILSELILTTEHEINLTLLNYVFEQKLAKTVTNEMSIAFALVSCLFSFCQGLVECCEKEKFIKMVSDILDWHIDAHEARKDNPTFQKVTEEVTSMLFNKYNDEYNELVSQIPKLKKEDLN